MNTFKTMVAAVLVPMALVLSLSACGISAGYVTDKDYKGPWVEQKRVYEQQCSMAFRTVYTTDPSTGQQRSRQETYQDCHDEWTGRYRQVNHDAEYRLLLRNDDGDTGKVRVEKSVYDSYEIGDYFNKEHQ